MFVVELVLIKAFSSGLGFHACRLFSSDDGHKFLEGGCNTVVAVQEIVQLQRLALKTHSSLTSPLRIDLC